MKIVLGYLVSGAWPFNSILQFLSPNHCHFFFLLDIFSGLCPDESYEEAMADMICDGVTDLFNVGVKIFLEKDENKKVHLTALF